MRFSRSSAWLIAATLAGCGQAGPSPVTKSPHNGTLITIPDGNCQVEVVRRDVSGQPGQSQLALYLLDAEGRPMASPPTLASLRLRDRGSKPINFKTSNDSDPAHAGELITDPFPAQGGISGELTATVDSKPIAIPIDVR